MKIILQDNKKLLTTKLPKDINGNYWITDSNGKNLVNIESVKSNWVLKSNNDIKIIDNKVDGKDLNLFNGQIDFVQLNDFVSGLLYDINNGVEYKFFCLPTYDYSMIQIEINKLTLSNIIIGNSDTATIRVKKDNIAEKQLEIMLEDDKLKIVNYNLNTPLYINNMVSVIKYLNPGDYCFIDGFYLCFYGNILVFNNPNNVVTIDENILKLRNIPNNEEIDYSKEVENNLTLYNKKDYFARSPRFKRLIEPKEFKIDLPTQKQINEDMPAILTIGPMMIMGMTSIISGFNAVLKVKSGQNSLNECMSSIIMSASMLMGMIVFPIIQKIYIKFRRKKKEKKRVRKYGEYIDKKREEINKELELQKQILLENNVSLDEVEKIILEKRRDLWERKIEHFDFLSIRLGIGKIKSFITVSFPEEHFTVEEDNLRELGDKLVDNTSDLINVPVTLNLVEKRNSSFIGNSAYLKKYLDGIILQLLCFCSYDLLKIVVLTDSSNIDYWKKYKNIPHFWSNDRSIRFIGSDISDIDYISSYILEEYNNRVSIIAENDSLDKDRPYLKFKPYYLIITDSAYKMKNNSLITTILNSNINYGFSTLMVSDRLDDLPNEVSLFVNIEPNISSIFEQELVTNNQIEFTPEIPLNDLSEYYVKLCNIPVDIADGKFDLPSNYSFLEMYDVGNVNQLNIINRWKESNVTQSLSAPVGINEQGELFRIDLHEKAHGPHGLVAGMTGSGKSEWIITYILSMCINYHPYEVQFVLIDYKGGGLAGTFENKETGFRLPHLAGTITNLDKAEINRSLASINSELKRRQAKFNEERDKLGESSIDIYKYQRLYREGKINEPISHLFIISDEFAELKSQQPEFMAELISTARIGRSLGVHLILATQKPSGVVDDQIWSNSKFRVCLKVQDKSDSNDMIRVPDAAYLKEAGRFYLQVGYNEYFAKGQSAYAGSPYYESEKHKTVIDSDLEFVNIVGQPYKEINTKKEVVDAVFKGEELPFILNAINDVAKSENISIKNLWLDAIPAKIYITDLLKKYNYNKENFLLNPVIGEYDAPTYQKQNLLTLPLSKKGNVLIYGMANSGKEDLLTTILYSLMTNHVAIEVNSYIIDCGSGTLNSFKNSPIVGDIVGSNDSEKLHNLFKKLLDELETRKELFKNFNGDYYYYCTHQENKLPNIVVILNNFDAFQELYPENDEVLVKLTREGEKLGILFIFTVLSNSSIRFKLSQNFKQVILLQMNEEADYRTLLTNPNRVVPSNIKGRGLVSIDEVYEFQTATPSDNENMSEYINLISSKLKESAKFFAPNIPVLPKIVNFDFIKKYITDINNIPIGVEKNSLKISKMNFMDKGFIITSNDETSLESFILPLFEVINVSNNNIKTILFNYNQIKLNSLNNIQIINEKFDLLINQFYDFIEKNKTLKCLLLINGIKFLNNDNLNRTLDKLLKIKEEYKNINIILIDTEESIKGLKFKSWFKDILDLKRGIWVSSGIQNQSTLELVNGFSKELREELPINEGYFIEKGKTIRIKLLESDKK